MTHLRPTLLEEHCGAAYDGILEALLELDLTKEQFAELAAALDLSEVQDLNGNQITPCSTARGDGTSLAARLAAIYVQSICSPRRRAPAGACEPAGGMRLRR